MFSRQAVGQFAVSDVLFLLVNQTIDVSVRGCPFRLIDNEWQEKSSLNSSVTCSAWWCASLITRRHSSRMSERRTECSEDRYWQKSSLLVSARVARRHFEMPPFHVQAENCISSFDRSSMRLVWRGLIPDRRVTQSISIALHLLKGSFGSNP